MYKFIKAYIKSMRLYYAFITGIAGWIGVAFYEHLARFSFRTEAVITSFEKKLGILILLFLSWGINQIINDYLGLEEDKVNAPYRPMVTGELNHKKALLFSSFLIGCTFFITYFYLESIAIIPLLLGVLLNILYEYAKGYGILANIVFGVMISMGTIFGFLASGPTQAPYFTSNRLSVLLLVILMNGLMTFYTYFKDYEGDKKANKNTIVVKHGIEKSRYIALFSSLLPLVFFVLLYSLGLIRVEMKSLFFILYGLTIFLFIWTGFLYYKNPRGEKTYYSLSVNFRACSCGQAALIALFNPELAILLFLFCYIFVGFLFDLHANPKA